MMMLSLVGLVFTANAIDEKKLLDMTYAFASDTHWRTAKPFQYG
jgi:Asp-tRNA(Asn)/Glu-tRNA(Gln) amidotransferase A subunit family amidase